MDRISVFEKVSFEQFKTDFKNIFDSVQIWEYLCHIGLIPFHFNKPDDCTITKAIKTIYNNIQLPRRVTGGSAGYDFYTPFDIMFGIGEDKSIKIPTGIRCKIDNGWVLQIYPRSSLGFKYGIHLANTVGIIDSDYYGSDNEGHIMIKLIDDSVLSQKVNTKIKSGSAFCQGIFLPFGIAINDNTTVKRNGGLGSTDV